MITRKYLSNGVNIVLDGQWGSTGKGKLCAWLGEEKPDLVCSSFGPNAGHTFIKGDQKIVFKHMPSSAITAGCPVLIMPDSVLNVDRFLEEVKVLQGIHPNIRILVHPRTAIITPEDKANAEMTGRHLAGTMQGTGHALARKMLRIEGTKLAKDVTELIGFIGDTCELVRNSCRDGATVLFEMSQGFDLSLNHGFTYPYLTSRDITVGAAMNSCGIPAKYLGNVIGSIRCHPIRVGNVDGGNSGPCHPDQCEISWDHISDVSKSDGKIVEKTTVTGRVRRVFTFSVEQVRNFVEVNAPDFLFLNHIQYLDWTVNNVTNLTDLLQSRICARFVGNVSSIGSPVALVGTGADHNSIIETIF